MSDGDILKNRQVCRGYIVYGSGTLADYRYFSGAYTSEGLHYTFLGAGGNMVIFPGVGLERVDIADHGGILAGTR